MTVAVYLLERYIREPDGMEVARYKQEEYQSDLQFKAYCLTLEVRKLKIRK